MFSNKSLNFKLRASFGVLLVLLIAVGAAGMHFLDQTSDQFRHVADINLEKTIMLEHLDSSSREIFRRILQYEVNGNTQEDFIQIDQNIEEHLKEYETYRLKYEAIPFVEGEKKLYNDLEETWKNLQPFIKELPPIAKSIKAEDHVKFGEIYRVELKQSRTHFFDALEKLKNFQIEESEKWIAKAEESAKHSDRFTIFTVTAGLIFGALIAYFISRALTNQILEVTRSLHAGAQVVAEASNEIAQISEELSSSVNQQASAIQETSASTEELSAMVKKNQENASLSTNISKQSSTTANNGQMTIQDMIRAIKDIEHSNKTMINTVEENNVNIQEIIHVIHEISSKTNVINEIVFQTKLLSFNASVEAARAGEQGKGFAVVAEEIGSLAQMSGTAAKEISDLLQSSTSKVENIVHQTKSQVGDLMEASKVKVEHGITIAHRCNDVLDQIVGHIGHVDGMVGDISVASLEQSKGIIEISSAMSQLDQTTQINADSSRLMASSSEELSNQAQKLNLLVQDLKYTIEGKTA